MARRDPVGIRLITRNQPLAACGLSHRSPGTPGRVRKASLFSSEMEPEVVRGIVLKRPMPA
jgi:hypothetical protein